MIASQVLWNNSAHQVVTLVLEQNPSQLLGVDVQNVEQGRDVGKSDQVLFNLLPQDVICDANVLRAQC